MTSADSVVTEFTHPQMAGRTVRYVSYGWMISGILQLRLRSSVRVRIDLKSQINLTLSSGTVMIPMSPAISLMLRLPWDIIFSVCPRKLPISFSLLMSAAMQHYSMRGKRLFLTLVDKGCMFIMTTLSISIWRSCSTQWQRQTFGEASITWAASSVFQSGSWHEASHKVLANEPPRLGGVSCPLWEVPPSAMLLVSVLIHLIDFTKLAQSVNPLFQSHSAVQVVFSGSSERSVSHSSPSFMVASFVT